MTVVVYQEAASQVESGNLRALAVADEERLQDPLPDVPTLQEIGIDWTSASHLGLAVPNGTPEDRVQTLSECFREAIETDEFRQTMEEQNLTIDYLPPAEFDQYLQELSERYGQVIEEVGIQGPEG